MTHGERPLVMGIVNCTPDSFYPGSRRETREAAIAAARRMIGEGADILDIGGESTRPGSDPVGAEEERERVVPVIEALRAESGIPVSVDTRKAAVAGAALAAGADMVNDVSGLRDDAELAPLVAARGVPVVLMHMQGTPKTMQRRPHYEDTVADILEVLRERIAVATDAGIARDRIICDPGIGFGKTVADNLRILRGLSRFRAELDMPVLVGLSRKSFIGKVLGEAGEAGEPLPVEERLTGTLAAHAWAAREGADILRVHDVAETVQLVTMLEAIATVERQ
ncbi:MAG: dihydropteroate synthase [Spirochaetia bacterium]